MAISKYSQLYNVSKPVDSVDLNMLSETLGTQQAKYDQGYLAISTALDFYKTPGLVAEKDQEYVKNKVAALTDQIDGYGNSNLADAKVVAELNRDAKSLSIDPEFMSMVSSQANAKKLVERYEKLKTDPKGIKFYSPENEILQMKELNDWRSGKTKNFSSFSPILKYDTEEFASEIGKTLKANLLTIDKGVYLDNRKIKTEGDLTTVINNGFDTNMAAQQQLDRNQKVLFLDKTPRYVKDLAIKDNANEIAATTAELKIKNDYLLKVTTDVDQKEDLKVGVAQLERRLKQLNENAINIASLPETEEVKNQLGFQVYKSNYVKGVAQKYVQNDSVLTANPVGMQRDKFVNAAQMQQNEFNHVNERDRLNREAVEKENEANRQLKVLEIYGGNGDVADVLKNGGNSMDALRAATSSITYQPTVQTEVKPFDQVTSETQSLQKANSDLAKGAIKDIMELQFPELAHKLKGVLDTKDGLANLAKDKSLPPAAIKILTDSDAILQSLSDPKALNKQILNNESLNKYGSVRNQILENTIQIEALNELMKPDKDALYKEYYKKGLVKNRTQFDNAIKNDADASPRIVNTPNMGIMGGYSGTSTTDVWTLGGEIRNKLNEKLKVNSNYTQYNEFNALQSVGTADKRWNSGSADATNIRRYLKSGIVDSDGVVKGYNGDLNISPSKRANSSIDGIDESKVEVSGFMDSKNRVYYKLPSAEKGGPTKEVYVELNDDNYRSLRNTTASQVRQSNFGRNLYAKGGQMNGYFNMNGRIKMGGNIQFKFHMFSPDKYTTAIKIPTDNGGFEDKVIGRYDSRDQAEEVISKAYNTTKGLVENQVRKAKPDATQEEIDILTLANFYNGFKTK